MKFRADIEGLRGVAVLLVVLSHARVPGFAGGFIGVDIFFVISGYLITGLLSKELQSTGAVDYWAFYARRVRRLAPALMVMLVVVSGSCLAFLPGELIGLQLQSAVWATLWLSNFYFAFAQFDYFGASSQASLFLHTWSLGVEEQFYLVWPFVLLLARRRWPDGVAWLAWTVAAGFGLSLVLMWLDATSAYYLMPSRLWQLALGGLVYCWFKGRQPVARSGWGPWLGIAGLAMLLGSLLLIDGGVAYPGLWAALPSISAALLLAAGTDAESPVARSLASPLLRLPGRISYSWYLWHWPVLAIGPLLGIDRLEGILALAAVLVSFLVGWVSWACVEQPFRRRAAGTPRTVVLGTVAASLALAVMLPIVAKHVTPTPAELQARKARSQLIYSMDSRPSIYDDERCDQWYSSSELVPCDVDTGGGTNGTILLIADSVGTQWVPALERAARIRGMRLQVLTKSACPIVDEPVVYSRIHRRYTECEAWRDRAIEHAAQTRPALVVIGSSSSYGFSSEKWVDGSQRLLRRLSAASPRVVVLVPTPILPFDAPLCAIANATDGPNGLDVQGCTADLAKAEDAEVISALAAAVANVPGTHLLTMNDVICPAALCQAYRDGQMLYRDEQHLNARYVSELGEEFARRLPPPVPDPVTR